MCKLLNYPGSLIGRQHFSIASDESSVEGKDIVIAKDILDRIIPDGTTPLNAHLTKIHEAIFQISPKLLEERQVVSICIATDGLPTDETGYTNKRTSEQFVNTLKLFQELPVWISIKLCTNESEVVSFYSHVATSLASVISIVLHDNFITEAREVYQFNPWLTYAVPLHRARELCMPEACFNLMDRRLLSHAELQEFISCLFFGVSARRVHNPATEWENFFMQVEGLVKEERNQWNPITRCETPWIDLDMLKNIYLTDKNGKIEQKEKVIVPKKNAPVEVACKMACCKCSTSCTIS